MRAKRAENLTRDMYKACLATSFALFALASCLVPGSAVADDVDRVRELRSTASIMPLSRIMQMVELRYHGTLLEVELEEEKGLVVYEIQILGKDQVVHTLKVNARNAHILSVDKDD